MGLKLRGAAFGAETLEASQTPVRQRLFLVHFMYIMSVSQSYRSEVNVGASHRGQQTGNKLQFRVHIFYRIAIIMVFTILAFYFSPRTEGQP